jgi:hypothetical protein
VTKKWTVSKVCNVVMAAQIIEAIGEEPGSKAFLSKYRAVSSEIKKALPQAKRDEFQALADTWNIDRPPRHVQKK